MISLDECVDINRFRAFYFNGVQIFLADFHVISLTSVIAANTLFAFHQRMSFFVNILLFQTVARFLVQHMEADFL